ncbi:hypothetical protein D3C87_1796060 [compost metagenome]
MQCPNALDHLLNGGRLRGIREALGDVPLRQRRQALLQRVDGVLVRVLGEVAHDGIAGRRQKPTPGYFEMLHRGTVAAPGVFPGASLQVTINLVHLDPLRETYLLPRWKKPKSTL